MKKCYACGRQIDVTAHPYANIYRHSQTGNMVSYHLDCLVNSIKRETQEVPA